ncbi:MAG: carbohydrate kinase, partial [Lachnospiraceae bacterium]|nr:carbohydrate kinase [Lachnospiraceae bacterium]
AATLFALDEAKAAKAIISFDPNIREPLWDSMDEAREQVLKGLEYCDILKISDNEIQWLTGIDDYADGVKWILNRYPTRLVTVSLGKNGSMAFYRKNISDSDYVMASADPFLQEDTIETTGAGDTFNGCILHGICQKGLDDLSTDNLEEMLIFANAAASIITTRRGALYVMPEKDEIEELIRKRLNLR